MGNGTRRLTVLSALVLGSGLCVGAAVAQPTITALTGTGAPGGQATFSVTLGSGGTAVAGTQNDIGYDPNTPIGVATAGHCSITIATSCTGPGDCPLLPPPFTNEACIIASGQPSGHCAVTTGTTCTTPSDCPTVNEPCIPAGEPNCTVNSAISPPKQGFFSFQPNFCSNETTKTCNKNADCTSPGTCTVACVPGTNCTGIRAIIVAVDNLAEIPDGSTLYSCTANISGTAAQQDYPLPVTNVSVGDTSLNLVAGNGVAGKITVGPSGDADGDGVPDATDNCPYTANADQKDTGGVGAGSAPDGIGDVCQCGDVNGNGTVTLADSVIILRSLLIPPTATVSHPELCDVGGSAGCTLADSVIILRANLSPPTATVLQQCAPAKQAP